MAERVLILRLRRMALAPSPPAPLPLKGVRGVWLMPRLRQRRGLIPPRAGEEFNHLTPLLRRNSPRYCDGVFLRRVISALLFCAA